MNDLNGKIALKLIKKGILLDFTTLIDLITTIVKSVIFYPQKLWISLCINGEYLSRNSINTYPHINCSFFNHQYLTFIFNML